MDIEFLEKFCENKGFEIARVLADEYDSADFHVNSLQIEQEIYEIATNYSKIFFFEAREFLQESVREEVRTRLAWRFDRKQVQKMKDIDLAAHWIKLEVVRALEDRDISLL